MSKRALADANNPQPSKKRKLNDKATELIQTCPDEKVSILIQSRILKGIDMSAIEKRAHMSSIYRGLTTSTQLESLVENLKATLWFDIPDDIELQIFSYLSIEDCRKKLTKLSNVYNQLYEKKLKIKLHGKSDIIFIGGKRKSHIKANTYFIHQSVAEEIDKYIPRIKEMKLIEWEILIRTATKYENVLRLFTFDKIVITMDNFRPLIRKQSQMICKLIKLAQYKQINLEIDESYLVDIEYISEPEDVSTEYRLTILQTLNEIIDTVNNKSLVIDALYDKQKPAIPPVTCTNNNIGLLSFYSFRVPWDILKNIVDCCDNNLPIEMTFANCQIEYDESTNDRIYVPDSVKLSNDEEYPSTPFLRGLINND